MIQMPAEVLAVRQASELEPPLAAVEQQLAALAQALREPHLATVDSAAAGLHKALSAAVHHFARAANRGQVPAELRARLAAAGGQVAAQREALARATASLDRAIDVLLPGPVGAVGAGALYSASGGNERAASSGGMLA